MRSQKPNSQGNVHNLILDNVPEIIYFVETNGDPTRESVKFVSPSVKEIVGYTRDEFTKNPALWISIIHPDDAGAVQRTTEEMFATKKRIPRQYRLRHKVTGEYVWMEDNPSLIIDRNGKITGYVGVAREAERALRESEQKFKAQFDGFPLPTYTWQIQEDQIVLTGYNFAAGRATNQYVQQLLGRSARDVYPDRPDILEDFGICLSTKRTLHREIVYRFRVSGDVRDLAVDYVFVPPDLIMVHTEDITERKRAQETVRENEERLRVALAPIDMAVFNQDTDLRYTWMYQPQLRYTTERVMGKTDAELLPHEAARQVTEIKRRVLETCAPARGEVQVTLKDRIFYYDLIVEPLRNANGQVTGITGASLDITERKRAEQELQKLSRVVQQTADIVFITDRNGLIEYVNPAFEKITGYRHEEVIGKTPRILKSGEYPESFYHGLWKTILDGLPFQSILINKKKDGTNFFEEKTITPLRAEDGTITHFVSTGKDVTERKDIERAALKQFKLAETFFNHSVSCLVILDKDFNFIRVNKAYARACRRDISEFVGRNHFEMYPSDAKVIFDDVVRTKQPFTIFTKAFVFPDQPERGVTYWDWTLLPILDQQGEVEYLVFSLNDVTERKQAEEALRQSENKYRGIFENIHDVYFETAVDGKILEVSPSIEILSRGQYTRDDILGKSMFDFYFDPKARLTLINSLREQKRVSDFEIILKNRDGSFLECSVSAKLQSGADGNPEIIIGTLRDISRRKQAEEIARTHTERLQALSKQLLEIQENERRSIARELHDEIGQTLTSLKILLEMSTKAKAGNAHESLQEALGLISSLIGRVRDLSLNLRPPALDDLGLVPAIRWHLLHRTEKMGIEVHFKVEPEEIDVSGEIKTACFRVAQEALTNVLKHSKPKSVEVQVMKRGANLELTVRDDGTGFDVDSAFRRAAAGESFGLLGMQERVRLAGGTLVIRSEQGQGSEVQATFPNAFVPS